MASTPIDVTENVTGVSWQSPLGEAAVGVQAVYDGNGDGGVVGVVYVNAIVSARADVAAPAGMADATMSPPAAATLLAATRNSGLCMGFPPVELVKA